MLKIALFSFLYNPTTLVSNSKSGRMSSKPLITLKVKFKTFVSLYTLFDNLKQLIYYFANFEDFSLRFLHVFSNKLPIF